MSDKFTFLNIFTMELAQRCSDNGGCTAYSNRIVSFCDTIIVMSVRYHSLGASEISDICSSIATMLRVNT